MFYYTNNQSVEVAVEGETEIGPIDDVEDRTEEEVVEIVIEENKIGEATIEEDYLQEIVFPINRTKH
ncbi:MAG: hypothetical protein LRY73_03545 [Bacillus sp. (in: Bacteria)]|nr:hypothetical protein [Bacillus sp. (in: firmicutes)]